MFARTLTIALTLLALATGGLTFSVVRLNKQAYDDYQNYGRGVVADDSQPIEGLQHRKGIFKQVWQVKGDETLYHTLAADRSTLEFQVVHGQPQLIEHLADLEGTFTEGDDLFRDVVSDHASYSYHDNRLLADEATIVRRSSKKELLSGQTGRVDYRLGQGDLAASDIKVVLHEREEAEVTAGSLHMIGSEQVCLDDQVKINFANGNSLTCWQAELNLTEESANFYAQLPHHRVNYSTDTITVTSNALQIDELVTAVGNVVLIQEGFGQLTTDELSLNRSTTNEIETITCTGSSTLESNERTLFCPGSINVDEVGHHLTMKAAPSGEQICYTDALGMFRSDDLELDYDPDHHLTKICLSGNVALRNFTAIDYQLQYALADLVEYDVATEVLTLTGSDESRVLLLDEEADTRVSAEKLVIHRDTQVVEGVGNVRFALSKEEAVKFRSVFDND